jgi:hypothetical protein
VDTFGRSLYLLAFSCAGLSREWFPLSVVDAIFRLAGVIDIMNQSGLRPDELKKTIFAAFE